MALTAILDVDGTLVDTNYHHTLAWHRAFRQSGIVLPLWRIHRHMGMGGDQLVAALTDERTDAEKGDEIRAAEKVLYMELIDEVAPMHGARELMDELRERGHTIVLASSAKASEIDRYLDLLDARELAHGWTTSADVDATKPQPDLVRAALDKGGNGNSALLLGDTTWDVEAAKRAGVEALAVRTGGFGRDELEAAGATLVLDSLTELRERLDETPFA